MKKLSNAELEAIIAPVRDQDETDWTEEQAQAELELNIREHQSGEGQQFETMRDAAKHGPRTVPISIRMPIELLDRVRQEAERRGTPYQRLIRDLVEAGLAAGSSPLARLEVSAELLERIATERSVTVEVRRAS